MNTRIEIGLDVRPPDRISADILVAGFFQEDRPLRGATGRIDWRLCGLVSRMIESDELGADRGAALLVSMPGVMQTPRVLLLGLGSRVDFVLTTAQDVMRDAVERCLALGARRIALSPLGIAPEDFARYAAVIVGGAAEAFRASDPGAESPPLDLNLVVPERHFDLCMRSLEGAVVALSELGVAMQDERETPHQGSFDLGPDSPSAQPSA